MKIQTQLFVIALTGIFASCGTVSSDAGASDTDLLSSGASTSSDGLAAMYAPAPSGEMAPTQRYDVAQIVVADRLSRRAGRVDSSRNHPQHLVGYAIGKFLHAVINLSQSAAAAEGVNPDLSAGPQFVLEA